MYGFVGSVTFENSSFAILGFWNCTKRVEHWPPNILPKKGDLSLPKNYWGIMLLETAYKIIAKILHSRLLPIEENLDHEPQCGFHPGRGCMDAIFTIKTAIKKCSEEHGLESWVLFLDLVKAFDHIPRELLWMILAKFEVPKKLDWALHNDFKVKFTVNDVISTIACVIRVKQGHILGPILFTFFTAAIMIIWKATNNVTAWILYSKNDTKLTGRSYQAWGKKVLLLDSEYADYTAILFNNCEDLTNCVNSIVTHISVGFGMEVHTGKIESRGESKTEILFCSKPCSMYNNPDSYYNADVSDITVSHDRYIPIVDHFSYLGSIISTNCIDNDVEARIRKAGSAFGALSLYSHYHMLIEK